MAKHPSRRALFLIIIFEVQFDEEYLLRSSNVKATPEHFPSYKKVTGKTTGFCPSETSWPDDAAGMRPCGSGCHMEISSAGELKAMQNSSTVCIYLQLLDWKAPKMAQR